jgi:branched-chain amino acid aminotransferase
VKEDSKYLVYLNGRFVPEGEACVSVFDRGFLYGDGVFETMRSYGGRIFRLDRHMQRLRQSADIIELRLPHEPEQLAEICSRLLERNGVADAIVRISVTRGRSVGGIGTAQAGEPSVVAFIRPPRPLPAEAYTEGVSAKVVSVRRNPSAALDARMKSMNFLNYILAKAEAERAGAYQAIMLNHAGYVAEASTANVFFASGDRLVTPSLDCDILPGITRAAVLEIASDAGIHCEERKVEPSEIRGFQECFLTSSGVELVPLTIIDEAPVGTGRPGPVYARLHRAYRELARKG